MIQRKIQISIISILIVCTILLSGNKASASAEPTLFNFENGLQGWIAPVVDNTSYGTASLSIESTIVNAGKQALKMTMNGGKAYYRVDIPKEEFKVGDTITYNFYVPTNSTMHTIQLQVGGAPRKDITITKKGEWFSAQFTIPEGTTINLVSIHFIFPTANPEAVPKSDVYIDSVNIAGYQYSEADYSLYNFENGIHGWSMMNPTGAYGTGTLESVNTIYYKGRKALKVNLGGGFRSYRAMIPLTGSSVAGKTYEFYVYIPNIPEFQYMEVRANPAGITSYFPTKDNWFKCTYTVPAGTTVTSFFINFHYFSGGAYPASSIYIDSFHDGGVLTPPKSYGDLGVTFGAGGSVQMFKDGNTTNLISGNNGTFTSDTLVELTALPNHGYSFAYWKNKNGSIASQDPYYPCYIGKGLNLEAVFVRKMTESTTEYIVSFVDNTGIILKQDIVAKGQGATPPPNPKRKGYVFVGWDTDISNVTTDLVVRAIYKREDTTYTVTVINGLTSSGESVGNYKFDTPVTIIANEPAAGFKFSHWEQDGIRVNILSTHSFYVPMNNTTLKAVYTTDTTPINTLPFISLSSNVIIDAQNYKISFIATRFVSGDYQLVESGVLLFKGELTNELTLETQGVIRGMISNSSTSEFLIRKAGVNAGETWHARGYLIYSDGMGNTYTTYSGTVSVTME